MADYLYPGNKDIAIEKQKWLFKCVVEDIEIKWNHKRKHTNIFCSPCQQNKDQTQFHILNCFSLLVKNEAVPYIPECWAVYQGSWKDQIYVLRVPKENYINRVSED